MEQLARSNISFPFSKTAIEQYPRLYKLKEREKRQRRARMIFNNLGMSQDLGAQHGSDEKHRAPPRFNFIGGYRLASGLATLVDLALIDRLVTFYRRQTPKVYVIFA